ncbi:hypothetical protein FW774_17660 [Pedobacter sp. BS3]|uniref:hypothetical protein n=1 Tax=Pedobacter sp. BS3 TaxID=2567937 RepID=UPI0011EC47FB|nr:hypothetical protein [Pedobacter sp. BS3]TZF81872.1 hypothetical protein FW774_17660 [Pedobacter sp. BS3]
MKNFQASAVERRITVTHDFASHPMEAGWASEAIFFIIVEEVSGAQATLETSVEISADGINWIDEGTSFAAIHSPGHYAAKVSHFGNWLRVHGKITGTNPAFKLSVHLHLKG